MAKGWSGYLCFHSPRIAKIEVIKEGDVRRSKLYYLRGTSGKKAKVKGRFGARKPVVAEAENAEAVQETSALV